MSSSHSYYSGTESQRSISVRSFYDNVDETKDSSISSNRFLMPPKCIRKISIVKRSKSFQETTRGQADYLSIKPNRMLRENPRESRNTAISFIDFSVIPFQTAEIENRFSAPPCLSCDRKGSGPFYVKILRRLQKLSLRWRKCKRFSGGTIKLAALCHFLTVSLLTLFIQTSLLNFILLTAIKKLVFLFFMVTSKN